MSEAQPLTRVMRNKETIDYYALEHPKLHELRVTPAKNKLYAVKILDSETIESGEVYRIHYVGYSHHWNEWRKVEEIKSLPNRRQQKRRHKQRESRQCFAPEPASSLTSLLFVELAVKIKAALNGSRRDDSKVRIEISCGQEWFEAHLIPGSMFKRRARRHIVYTISSYSSLNYILGCNWHYRGINKEGDFSYVLSTVEFYLHEKER